MQHIAQGFRVQANAIELSAKRAERQTCSGSDSSEPRLTRGRGRMRVSFGLSAADWPPLGAGRREYCEVLVGRRCESENH